MIDKLLLIWYLIHISLLPYCKSTLRLPGLKPGVCSGLILSGVLNPVLKIGVWRRRMYQISLKKQSGGANGSS